MVWHVRGGGGAKGHGVELMINIAIVSMHVILYIDILGPTLATAPLAPLVLRPVPRPVLRPEPRPVLRPVPLGRKKEDIHISQQSLVKILNKSTSIQTLALERVQLIDITVSPS